MKLKKILGVALSVLLGVFLLSGLFILVFTLMINRGYAIWLSAVIGLVPFAGAAAICGVLWLIFYLLNRNNNDANKEEPSK